MDNYVVLGLIGEGSFGRVYKATEKQNDKTVALKIIAKRGRTNKEIINFRGECEIQNHLCHPNIIQIMNSFETPDEIVVVTEYAQSDLHKLLIREHSIPEERARTLTHELVSALYYLHSHRILHRDLKPQNILLDHEQRAKLCDFGLARNMTMGTHVLTSIKGTPLYMAPELMSEKPYDHQADLWSLGCIIYETMAGQPPFSTTSFIKLVKLIRHENVRWPSFLTDHCISFLDGLLQKDPSDRLSWTAILEHPFVKGHIIILDEPAASSPFTHPMSQSLCLAKEKQFNNLTNLASRLKHAVPTFGLAVPISDTAKPKQGTELISSQDSIHAILQSDMENIETDVEDNQSLFVPGNVHPSALVPLGYKYNNVAVVSGNSNLIINHLNDNFQMLRNPLLNSHSNKELERRKLSQNLENFSVRLSGKYGSNAEQRKEELRSVNRAPLVRQQETGISGCSIKERVAPSLRPGWDSCDEHQSPPIENEEWLAFLHRSMQEVLEGEMDSLKQQNLVSIIVAPLRNAKASPKVVECVAQLLSLPLIVDIASKDLQIIRSVYLEVKLVPNLVYASKLLCTSNGSSEHSTNAKLNYKLANQLTTAERKTLLSLYELICHLVHLNDKYLTQFCDAVDILGASELLANLMVVVSDIGTAIQLTNCILALLCFALRKQPENAELVVEKVMFHPNVSFCALLNHRNTMLKIKTCRMLRMLGRFCCCGLQSVWSPLLKSSLEALLTDPSDEIRCETERVVAEFGHLSFYNEEIA